MVMPRNVMMVAGPSSLSKATGIPNLSHTLSMVSLTHYRWVVQVGQPGGSHQGSGSDLLHSWWP